MADVIDFPGRSRMPPVADLWADPALRELDATYIVDVLRARLPAEALRRMTGHDLLSTARAALLAADTARHARRFDTSYDERRASGQLDALESMFLDVPPHDRPEPPDCA